MAARSAVAKSIPIEDAPQARGRARLSGSEGRMLTWGFGFACFALAISVLARIATTPTPPIVTMGLGLGVFFLGCGAALAGYHAMQGRSLIVLPRKEPALNDILASLPVGVAIWDNHGHLLRVNMQYTEFLELARPNVILGAPRESIRAMGGRPLDSIMPPVGEHLHNSQGEFAINSFALAGGLRVEVVTDCNNEFAAHDQINALTLSNAELEAECAFQKDRADLLAADLTQALDRATAAEHVRTDFLATMSHELRTPLNAVLGFSDMMRTNVFGQLGHPKYQEYAQDIYGSGIRLQNIIAAILDVSEASSDDAELDAARFDLAPALADCVNTIRHDAFDRGITIREYIEPLPFVHADEASTREILAQILSNAVKFNTPNGRISIRTQIDMENVTIAIEDSGIGMSAQQLERLDTPFTGTSDDAEISAHPEAGVGAGLANARRLAAKNGAALEIESEIGLGTTARLTLPRRPTLG